MSIRTTEERVLTTLNPDGSRRWMQPTPAKGKYWQRRQLLGWLLIAIFVTLPRMVVGGKQAVLLDLARGEFTVFGATLYATDTLLLMLFLLAIFLAVFLLTALFGRVWCGWGCPQTVYMEFLFRPLERLLEGKRPAQLVGKPWHWRKLVKWGVFAAISSVLANIFLAYFVPVDTVLQWATRSPLVHPQGFAVVAITAGLMLLDFGWFREQMCVVACPYARLQSVLIDKHSLIVAYDAQRGEPRGKLRKTQELSLARTGDCVDCDACVKACPTGLDIRNGFALECISCTQCVDACDNVMAKIGKQQGLVRYSTQAEIRDKEPKKWLRPRTLLYPAALALVVAALLWAALVRGSADVTLLRGIGAPFEQMTDGSVSNQVRVRIHNHSGKAQKYAMELVAAKDLTLVAAENPLAVLSGETRTISLFIGGKPAAIGGKRAVQVRVRDGERFDQTQTFQLLGPK